MSSPEQHRLTRCLVNVHSNETPADKSSLFAAANYGISSPASALGIAQISNRRAAISQPAPPNGPEKAMLEYTCPTVQDSIGCQFVNQSESCRAAA
jgi:hypothetical protein